MGVTYDDTEKKFVFDFVHDDTEDFGLSIRTAVDSAHKKNNLYHYRMVMAENSIESLKKEFVQEVLSEQSYDTLKEWLYMHEEARYVASLTSKESELIKFKPSLQLMYELKEALKQLFKCEVDLVRLRDSLRPLFKSNIERDVIYV